VRRIAAGPVPPMSRGGPPRCTGAGPVSSGSSSLRRSAARLSAGTRVSGWSSPSARLHLARV
jgi:hypothetical protein